jgi:hypothetical protein
MPTNPEAILDPELFFTPAVSGDPGTPCLRVAHLVLCLSLRGIPWTQSSSSSSWFFCWAAADSTGAAGADRDRASRSHGGTTMKWMGTFFLGYVLLLAGIVAALWKVGVLANVSGVWIAIGTVIALGVGLMVAVANSGRKETIQIDK